MVNIGWWNRRGSVAPSILRAKGDLEIWFNALLIASFPKPLRVRLLYLRSRWCSCSYEKDSLGGVLDLYNYHPSHRQKRSQTRREFIFVVHGVIPSLDSQSPFALGMCKKPKNRKNCFKTTEPMQKFQFGSVSVLLYKKLKISVQFFMANFNAPNQPNRAILLYIIILYFILNI